MSGAASQHIRNPVKAMIVVDHLADIRVCKCYQCGGIDLHHVFNYLISPDWLR